MPVSRSLTQLLSNRAPRRIGSAVVALTMAATLTACGGSSSGSGAQTLKMAIPADEGCIDPQQLLGRSQLTIGRAMADSLVNQKGEEFEPWLASSWKVNDNATQFTFTLRDDVTFSDKSKLTAQTVVDNFNAIVKLGAKAKLASSYLIGMTSAEATDAKTVKVSFEKPNISFLQSVSTPSMGILSDASTKASQADRCLGKFTGSGPMTLASYRSNEAIKLTRRDDYAWAPDSLGEVDNGYPAIDVSIVGESSIRAGTLVSGQTDCITEIHRSDLKTLQAADAKIESQPNPGIAQQLWVNPANPVLADVAVRKALQIGINRKELIDSTLTKYQLVATSVLSSTTPGYVDHSSQLGYDPDGAKKLLDDAGWVPAKNGIRVKDGRELKVSLLYGSQLYGFLVPLMTLMQQELQEIGIRIDLRPLPDADANTAWVEKDYDLRISALTRANPDALRTGMSGLDPELDKILKAQAGEVDPDARMKQVAEAQERIIDQGYGVPINELALPMAHSAKVGNVVYTTDSLVLLSQLKPTS